MNQELTPQFVQNELQSAFDWSCKMMHAEFDDVKATLSRNHIRLDAHNERALALTSANLKFIVEETWKNLCRDIKRNNNGATYSRESLCHYWDITCKKYKYKKGEADRLYEAITHPDRRDIDSISTYLSFYQIAAISLYLVERQHKKEFSSLPRQTSLDFC